MYAVMSMDFSRTFILAALLEWALMIYPVFIKFLRYLHLQIELCFFQEYVPMVSYIGFVQGRMRELNRNNIVPKCILGIELVRKKSIMYYQQHGIQPFLKIVVALPTMVASCRGKF